MTNLEFRRLAPGDLQVLDRWLRTPRVKRWFSDADYIDTLAGHIDDPRIDQFMVLKDDRPLGYLQDYDIHGWTPHPLDFLPKGARGIDMFIGAEQDMAQGLGPGILDQRTAQLFAKSIPALGIDPHPDNTAALRAYAKAGFTPHSSAETPYGPAQLMVRWPDT